MEFARIGTQTDSEWADWDATSVNVETVDGGVRLARESVPTYVDPRPVVTADAPVADIALDPCGTLYVLGADGRLSVVDPGTDALRPLRCPDDGRDYGDPRRLCVTDSDIYVAYRSVAPDGTTTGRVRSLSKYLRQTRWVVTDAAAAPDDAESRVSFGDPVRLLAADEEVLLLDGGPGTGDVDDPEPDGFLAAVSPDGTAVRVIPALSSPADVARGDVGTLYVLTGAGDEARIRRFDPAYESRGAIDPGARYALSCLDVGGEDQLVAGETVDESGRRSLLRYVPADASFERLPVFRRGCRRVVRGPGRVQGESETDPGQDGVYVLDGTDGITFLTAARRTALNPASGRYDGQAVTRYDSGIPGVEWHRVTLSRELDGFDTQVRVRYVATDVAAQTPVDETLEWATLSPANPEDALLTDAVGRYLWVQLELLGGAFSTPRVDAVHAYFPRQSYLRYLPAIYQADDESRAFLERYLSLFETVFFDLEVELEHLTSYLDADGVPEASLSWLEGWLAAESDETWPADLRRALLADAPALYRGRGTKAGLVRLLGLYLEHVGADIPSWQRTLERERETFEERVEAEGELRGRPLSDAEIAAFRQRVESPLYVREYASLDCFEDDDARDPYAALLGCPECFLVLVRPFVDDDQFASIQRVVDAVRPAHAVGRAVRLQPWVLLGGHAYLGVNSVLPDRSLVVGRAGLGRDSVLGERETFGQLEVKSKLGDDTVLS